MWAAKMHRPAIHKVLLHHGAQIAVKNNYGDSEQQLQSFAAQTNQMTTQQQQSQQPQQQAYSAQQYQQDPQ